MPYRNLRYTVNQLAMDMADEELWDRLGSLEKAPCHADVVDELCQVFHKTLRWFLSLALFFTINAALMSLMKMNSGWMDSIEASRYPAMCNIEYYRLYRQ